MKTLLSIVALALLIVDAGCAKKVDLEKLPIGISVDITRQDGGVVRGSLTARDARVVTVMVGSNSRLIARDQIVDMQLADDVPSALPPTATFREYTIHEGTRIAVRLSSPVGSDSSRAEDPIEATLTSPVSVDGLEVLPAGSIVHGVVEGAQSSGKVKGRGTLALTFQSISVAGRDQPCLITARADFVAASGKKRDVATIGVGAGGGALLGALFGGGKGAAIGAGIGAGAGTGVALSTRGPQVQLGRGSVLSLTFGRDAEARVPLERW